MTGAGMRTGSPWRQIDLPIVIVFGALVVLVLAGIAMFPDTISVDYYFQQIQIASVLGLLAIGAMFVILLGEIDLSVPWVLTGSAMLACGLHSGGPEGSLLAAMAIPAGLMFGLLCGLWNGLGVAYLRAPSMVWTLGLNALILGASVFYAGGYNPQTDASELMRWLGVGRVAGGIPVAAIVWLFVAVISAFVLYRTALGAYIYGQGHSERVLFLAGVRSRRITLYAFVWAGICSAMGGILLSGYAGQAYQSMGDPLLLPTIAAVVLGGTQIQGGTGKLSGTIAGVLVLTLLASLLSVLQTPNSIRQIIYGTVIIVMLLLGRFSSESADGQ